MNKLTKRRKELGLTLEKVGTMVGVTKSTVKKWESGEIANMRRDKIIKLAKALKVDTHFILDSAETDTGAITAINDDSKVLSIFSKEMHQNILSLYVDKNVIGDDLETGSYLIISPDVPVLYQDRVVIEKNNQYYVKEYDEDDDGLLGKVIGQWIGSDH